MIWDFSDRLRTNVIWVGQKIPDDAKAFLSRLRFSIPDSPPAINLNNDSVLSGLAAAVFVQTEDNPKVVVDELNKYAVSLLDHDCLVIVLASSKIKTTAINNLLIVTNALIELKIPATWPTEGPELAAFDGNKINPLMKYGAPKPPHIFVYRDTLSVEIIADLLVRQKQRPSPALDISTEFKILGPAAHNIKTDHKLMLRRGFHDCTELHLSRLTGGHSGVQVYSVHATLRIGGRPLPFFVKVGSRHSIKKEWLNYDEHVRPYIPFHLAPHLIEERCALGAHSGIIVGDFVEGAESLGECARCGRAITAIGSLFDRTLVGWHRLALPKHGSLYTILGILLRDEVNPQRLALAMKHGAKLKLSDLKIKLSKRQQEQMLFSRIHGDLHIENVMVRGSDAIIIDFLAGRKDGVLLADYAALEVSLLVRAPIDQPEIKSKISDPSKWERIKRVLHLQCVDESTAFDKDSWERIARSLYTRKALQDLPKQPDPTEPYAWLATCIRQVRLHALPMQKQRSQYAYVLAYYLLQAAIKDPKAKAGEAYRRAIAYCLAEILINN